MKALERTEGFNSLRFGQYLARNPNLGEESALKLKVEHVKGEHLEKIKEMTGLKKLELWESKQFNFGDLAPLLKDKKLTELRLYHLAGLTGQNNVEKVPEEAFENLTSLSITGGNQDHGHLSGEGLVKLLGKCPNLTTLDLSFQDEISDTHLEKVAERCKKLEEVTLCYCPGIRLEGLRKLASHCPNLKWVNVGGCHEVLLYQLAAFKEEFPNVKVDREHYSFYESRYGYKPVTHE